MGLWLDYPGLQPHANNRQGAEVELSLVRSRCPQHRTMPSYELTTSKHRHHATNARRRKSFTAAHFRSLPRISADSGLCVTGIIERRIHHAPYPHPRNSTQILASERMLPRVSAESPYREEA